MIMRKIGSVVVLGIVGLAWSAQGALVVPVSQTLHCSAGAEVRDLNLSAEGKPADVVGGSSYGTLSHRADAKVEGVYQSGPTPVPYKAEAYATAGLTISGDRIGISTSEYYSYGGMFGELGTCQSKVAVSFDLAQASDFNLLMAVNPWGIGEATIYSGGQSVKKMTVSGGFSAGEVLPPGCDFDDVNRIASYGQRIALDAGRYDVEFILWAVPHGGMPASGTAEFSMAAVPEAGGLSILAVGVLVLRRRR